MNNTEYLYDCADAYYAHRDKNGDFVIVKGLTGKEDCVVDEEAPTQYVLGISFGIVDPVVIWTTEPTLAFSANHDSIDKLITVLQYFDYPFPLAMSWIATEYYSAGTTNTLCPKRV